MNARLSLSSFVATLFATLLVAHASAAEPAKAPTSGGASTAAAASGTSAVNYNVPQLGSSFRIVKPDGATLITGGAMTSTVQAADVILISEKQAIAVSGGRCAFNVKYDEASLLAATNTTNRIYSNDVLIAQNTKIDVPARVVKTIWTQPYFFAGVNNVRVVVNVTGAQPSVRWIRVVVTGTCGAAPVPGRI